MDPGINNSNLTTNPYNDYFVAICILIILKFKTPPWIKPIGNIMFENNIAPFNLANINLTLYGPIATYQGIEHSTNIT